MGEVGPLSLVTRVEARIGLAGHAGLGDVGPLSLVYDEPHACRVVAFADVLVLVDVQYQLET